MAATHTIRTTMRPDIEITVSHAEWEKLLEDGLIYEGIPPDPALDPFDARVADRVADVNSATRAEIDTIIGDLPDGVTDHGALTGLADDDHPQYLTQTRGDARYPLTGQVVPVTQRGVADGVATLGADGKLPASQLPDLAVTQFLGSSANQTSMLALVGQRGDWTVRTDLGTTWIVTAEPSSVIGSWTQLSYPTAPVTTVAGRTGAVVLTKADVGLGNVDNTADTDKPISAPQATALAGKASTAHTHGVADMTATGTPSASTFLRGDNTWAAPAGGSSADLGTVLTSAMTGAQIQALFDAAASGSAFYIAPGTVITSDRQLTLSHTKGRLWGSGEIQFTNAAHLQAAGKPSGLKVTGDDTFVGGIKVSNPGEIKGVTTQDTDTYNQGISIAAHRATVSGVTVDRFQQGIVGEPTGEFLDPKIIGNRVTNVLGRGAGPGSGSTNGEDGGDGIVVWGARAVIADNHVTAKAGADCRIGIHAEALTAFEVTALPDSASLITISGNVVSGPFRRGIAVEEINYAAITGNSVADATWWSIAVVNGLGNVVSGNTIRYSRTAADTQGSAWAPKRAPLHVRGISLGTVFSGNVVVVSGAADCYFHSTQEGTGRPQQPYIHANNFLLSGTGTVTEGLLMEYCDSPAVVANQVAGFSSKGIAIWDVTAPRFDFNSLVGNGAATKGIDMQQVPGSAIGNRIAGLAAAGSTGIDAPNHTTAGSHLSMNNFIGPMAIGIELFGTTAATVVTGNRYQSVTTEVSNAGSAVSFGIATTLGRSGGTVGFFGTTPIAKVSALTAPDASTVDATYGTQEAAVINNLRTRLGELETRLKNYGLLT